MDPISTLGKQWRVCAYLSHKKGSVVSLRPKTQGIFRLSNALTTHTTVLPLQFPSFSLLPIYLRISSYLHLFFVHFYLNIITVDPEAGLDLKPMKSKQYFTLYISPKSRKAKKQKRMNMKRRFSDFINVPTPTWRRNVADEQWDVISGKLLPEVWVGVRHLDHPNPAAQSSKIHGPADFPIWCLLK